jgi:hypothetical protein
MNIFFFVALMTLLNGCVAGYTKIANKTSQIGSQVGLNPQIYQTKNFKIFTLQKITDPKKNLRIYFEGDGKAFISRNVISPNPTPTSYFTVNLITQDPFPNIIYIARPCQFVEDKKCYQNQPEKYWTDQRFSREVLDSIDEVVEKFSKFRLEIVAYSGGATVAKYIAAKNQTKYHNVASFRTLAGNVDNQKFAEIHQIKKLESLADNKEILLQLQNIPQIHFIGNDDEVTPDLLASSYLEKLPKKSCTKIIRVSEVTHSSGWQANWKQLLRIKPLCQNKSSHLSAKKKSRARR